MAVSRRTASSGAPTRTACTALYGCSSRQRSIVAWNRLSLPRINAAPPAASTRCAAWHQCRFTLYQMSAACTMFVVSTPADLGRRRRAVGRPFIDPAARRLLAGEMQRIGKSHVAVAGRQRDVAHARGADGCIGLGVAQRSRDCVPGNRESGEIRDGIGNPAQSGDHVPLAQQYPRQLACRQRRRVVDRQPLHRPHGSGARIADRRARKRRTRDRIPDRNGIVERAIQLVQNADHHHPALAMADQHRHHSLGFVIPGHRPRPPAAAAEASLRQASVARIPDSFLRIAHGDQEIGEGLHRHHGETALEQDDPWRGSLGEKSRDVGCPDPPAIEGANLRGQRRVERGARIPAASSARAAPASVMPAAVPRAAHRRSRPRSARRCHIRFGFHRLRIVATAQRPPADYGQDSRGKNRPVRCT